MKVLKQNVTSHSKIYLKTVEKNFTFEFDSNSSVKSSGDDHNFIEYPIQKKYPPYWVNFSDYRSGEFGDFGKFCFFKYSYI